MSRVIALMPVFFALTGLSTSAEAFHGDALGAFALILAVAVIGKVFGGALGARLGGHGWRDSFAVGSLMNARGMVELIVLKIGLDAGVIGREMFTLLLLMAIVTTMMTTPMLLLFSRHRRTCRPGTHAIQTRAESASIVHGHPPRARRSLEPA